MKFADTAGMDMRHTPDLSPHLLADALGDIRAEIRALKAREAELRQAAIAARVNGPVSGRRYELSIRESRRRVLDRARLPAAILNDERFWKTSRTQTIVTRACGADDTPVPGHVPPPVSGPVRAADPTDDWARARQPGLDLGDAAEELVLFEDF